MKLDYKKTILVGFAFFLICAFWQAYDNAMPLILKHKFGLSETLSGLIMALDNILALFMLPLFGALSDNLAEKKRRFGRRTPFIVLGTIAAVIGFLFVPVIDNIYLLVGVLLVTLIAMSVFRSPAVALMPDVTCKPHRSKANAVINLMGTAGGICVLVFGILFKTSEEGKTDFFYYILATCSLMIFALAVFLVTVRENKWAKEMEDNTAKYFPDKETMERDRENHGKLTKGQLLSLIFILSSVALWFMGYNAVTSKYSTYSTDVLALDYNLTMLIAQGAAIVSYIPVGLLASKIGRKKSILIGVALLFTAFFAAGFLRKGTSNIIMYILFAVAGIGWATINVNSFPMVVELSKSSDVGKYTGFYYTAIMAAQAVTPVLSGGIMDIAGNMYPLFPYAAVCVALAFITMLFVKHGDNKPETPKDKLEMLAGADD
ncbi:MAG: MFS transporter [Clostridia bacterium]|nr:MFS transporter [Clostridia bacterium]